MANDETNLATLSVDQLPGQAKLTEYELSVLKAAGIDPEKLTPKDLEHIMLDLPAHSDRLQKIRNVAALNEGEIERVLDNATDKVDCPDDDDDSPEKPMDTPRVVRPNSETESSSSTSSAPCERKSWIDRIADRQSHPDSDHYKWN